jgi:3-oxoacyl-[acyl-carrier-protein] synthase-3
MALSNTKNSRIAGIVTCVPAKVFDNIKDAVDLPAEDVRKVVGMAGVSKRRIADDSICSSDLCTAAGRALIESLNWDPVEFRGRGRS